MLLKLLLRPLNRLLRCTLPWKEFYEEYLTGKALIKEKDKVLGEMKELESKINALQDELEVSERDLLAKKSKFDEKGFEKNR